MLLFACLYSHHLAFLWHFGVFFTLPICMSILVAFSWLLLILWGHLTCFAHSNPHFPVVRSCLSVQVKELLETSFANGASYWLFLWSSMGIHTPKKWHNGLKNHLQAWLFTSSFQGPVWEPTRPKSGVKVWRSTCRHGFPLALFKVKYGNPHSQKVAWRFKDPLADVTFHWLSLGSTMETHTPKKWHDRLKEPLTNMTFH